MRHYMDEVRTLYEGAQVNWTPIPGDGYRTVLADVSKLDASLAKDQGMYVGRGGEGGVKGRYGRFQEYLQSGAPVEQPRMSIGPYGEAVVGNGRHRFAVLRDQGLQTMPISVPEEDVDEFRAKFGATQTLGEASRRYLTVYRGEYTGNKGGFFWTEDREFARQFTQSGQAHEVLVRYIFPGDIYKKSADVYAGDEAGVDQALAAAKAEDYKAILLSEGPGEPKSIYVFDRSALMRVPPR